MRRFCLAPLVVLALSVGGCASLMEHNLGPEAARTPPPPAPSSTAPQRHDESPADDAPGAANNWP